MNSALGRYLVAVVIGGSVFLGLHYFLGQKPAEEPSGMAPVAAESDTAEQAGVEGAAESAPAEVAETATVAEIVAGSDAQSVVVEQPAEETEVPPAQTSNETAEAPATSSTENPATTTAQPPVAEETGAADQAVETAETPATEAASATEAVGEALASDQTNAEDKPAIDVVRVDNSGMAVIAGKAAPNSTVTITSNGAEIGTAESDASGEFVAIVETDNSSKAQSIAVESEVDGELQFSDDEILILPTLKYAADAEEEATVADAPPVIVKATEDEVVVLQPSAPVQVNQISIDSISYEETGEASVAGRGTPGNTVIVYVDNTPVAKTRISATGSWKVILDGLEAGNYTLRVDEIDVSGNVASRMETPFQRAFPADVERAQSVQKAAGNNNITYTVQPGNSLWVIATGRYGEGLKYHQIFAANKDQIRDPDLIYPGQVFVLPEGGE